MRSRTELRDLAALDDRLDLKRWTVWREGGRNPFSIQRSITGSMIFMLTLWASTITTESYLQWGLMATGVWKTWYTSGPGGISKGANLVTPGLAGKTGGVCLSALAWAGEPHVQRPEHRLRAWDRQAERNTCFPGPWRLIYWMTCIPHMTQTSGWGWLAKTIVSILGSNDALYFLKVAWTEG